MVCLCWLVCRRAQEAAAASEQEAAAAAEEAEHATWQAEHAESEGIEDEQTQALRLVASKWTKRYASSPQSKPVLLLSGPRKVIRCLGVSGGTRFFQSFPCFGSPS